MSEDRMQRARSLWRWVGAERPPFAVEPGPGQESVWDYPRPPRLEQDSREVIVRLGSLVIAQTRRALRVLETASPPTFLLPPADVALDRLEPADGSSSCEWKGSASYWSVRLDDRMLMAAAWSYPNPTTEFAAIKDHLGFYPARFECFVDGIRVQPQPGTFYAGWITPELTGPFKGEPGTGGW